MNGFIKFIIGWVVVFAIRLVPFRPPNVEPVLATMMPFSKRYGAIGAFLFGFLSIALFDAATGKVGEWTWITAVAYGAVGLGSWFYFRNREGKVYQFVTYGIIGTILYDAATGLTIGPLMFGQSFQEAFFGQIPFTAMHLLGNIALSLTLSPTLYRWIVKNEVFDVSFIFGKLKPQSV